VYPGRLAWFRHSWSYLGLVGLPLLGLLGVLTLGHRIRRPTAVSEVLAQHPLPVHSGGTWPVALVVLQIIVILIAARLIGRIFKEIGQPHVMGEMVAGVVLGPSLFGWLAPQGYSALFPPQSLGYLYVLSQLGLVLFMFLVGLSINSGHLREYGQAAVLTSHVSIAAPFALGSALALYLYPRFAGSAASFTSFALFMGAAMSITAFPVLARILAERNLLQSRSGILALTCAAVDDVTAWCILAYITVLIRSSHLGSVWMTLGGALLFVGVMLFLVKPLIRRFESLFTHDGLVRENAVAVIMLVMLASALATELLGIHLLFGAFCAGVIMPRNMALVRAMQERLESVTLLLFMPLFFAFTGLRTSIGLVRGAEMWLIAAAIIAVAVIGKMGGSMLAAYSSGMSWRDAGVIGALLNTRGLMELVILNIGLDLQVITPSLFTMMVMMALVTTFMTSPLLQWFGSRGTTQVELPSAVVRDSYETPPASSASRE
jgi:Kef-type K+ transport system membrane component KefB